MRPHKNEFLDQGKLLWCLSPFIYFQNYNTTSSTSNPFISVLIYRKTNANIIIKYNYVIVNLFVYKNVYSRDWLTKHNNFYTCLKLFQNKKKKWNLDRKKNVKIIFPIMFLCSKLYRKPQNSNVWNQLEQRENNVHIWKSFCDMKLLELEGKKKKKKTTI